MKNNLPRVLLFGRTNIGKSALFNRLTGQGQSIVFGERGVTRDYLEGEVNWQDHTFTLIDAGGLDLGKAADVIGAGVQQVIKQQLDEADLILFVCDITTGLLQVDMELAKLLRRSNKKTLLVLAKADNDASDTGIYEFLKLGFGEPFPVSAIHGRGIGDLLSAMVVQLPAQTECDLQKPAYAIAIIGKPNVGKSSLLNQLLHKERVIVSNIAGTTREAVSDLIHIGDDLVKITDTAGIRRKRSVTAELETIMVKTSIQAIRSSDVIVIVVDASSLDVCAQELKLLSYAMEQEKGVVLILNKTDLIDEDGRKRVIDELDRYQHLTKKVPLVWTSCLTGKNVEKVLSTIAQVRRRCTTILDESRITATVREALTKHPLYRSQQLLKVFKVRPMREQVPTFQLYVNEPSLFGESDLTCIENLLRSTYDLCGCPVRFSLVRI